MSKFGGIPVESGSKFGGTPIEKETDYQEQLTQEYSAPERALIGAGREVAELGQGAKQIGLQTGETFGLVSPEDVEGYRQQIAEEKALYEQGVGGTTAAKVGEVAGAIGATIPAIIATGGLASAPALSTRLVTSAALGAAESGLQPVYGDDFAEEKAMQVGTGAALGAGATYGLEKLASVMPKNLLSRFYKKAQEKGSDAIDEAEVLQEITGISMTPAEMAESKSLQMLENLARQSLFTADELSNYDQKVARQGIASVSKLAREISKPRKGAETVGIELQKAARQAADDAINTRKAMADLDYGKAIEASGGKDVIEPNNFLNELKSIVAEYSQSEASDARKVVSQAKSILSRSMDAPKRVPKEEAERLASMAAVEGKRYIPDQATVKPKSIKNLVLDRSFYGKAAQGTGNVFKDIDRNLDRQIAGRLNKALTKDLIVNEDLGDVGKLLKVANDNYAANSSSIKAIEASPLSRILGKEFDDVVGAIDAGTFNSISGEKAVKKIMALDPSEIRMTMRSLDKINPNTANDLRAFVLRDALENSLLPPSAGMKKGTMSFNKFQTDLNKKKIGAYGLPSKDSDQLKNIIGAMERIGDRSGLNFSETQVQSNMMDIGDKIASAMMGNFQKGAALALESAGLRRISKAMTTKEGREALKVLTMPYQGKTKLDRALNTIQRIGTMQAAESAGESIAEE